MLNTYLLLFYEFLKIGLFAVGGGYATIPFLFHLTEIYPWFTQDELTNMIAISNITPGPIGINMATYTGFTTGGVTGSVISTLGIIIAPFTLTLVTIYFINKFRKSKFIKSLFEALRPTSCALLSFVMLNLCMQNIFPNNNLNVKGLILTSLLFLIYPLIKGHAGVIILIGALFGVIFNAF